MVGSVQSVMGRITNPDIVAWWFFRNGAEDGWVTLGDLRTGVFAWDRLRPLLRGRDGGEVSYVGYLAAVGGFLVRRDFVAFEEDDARIELRNDALPPRSRHNAWCRGSMLRRRVRWNAEGTDTLEKAEFLEADLPAPTRLPSERQNLCGECGRENHERDKFCTSCGADIARRCSGCARGNPTDARFCGGCGSALP